MSNPKWNKGAPPSVGWWPACIGDNGKRDRRLIRWWDGRAWSLAALPSFTAKEATDCAFFEAARSDLIQWSERWWL